jgi:hypothetical protein
MPDKFLTEEEFNALPDDNIISDEEFEAMRDIRPDISQLDSLGAGVSQGLTAGFGDELYGLSRGLHSAVTTGNYLPSYRKHRDALRDYVKHAEEQNPMSYGAGELTGALGTAFLPGIGVGKAAQGASLAAKLGRGALSGAKAGALYGVGKSEGDSVVDIGKDALGGAAAGALIAPAGELGLKGLGKVYSKAKGGLTNIAENRAFKASTGQNKRAFTKAHAGGKVETRGRDLLSKDEAGPPVVGWFSNVQDVANKAAQKESFYRDKIREVIGQIDENIPPPVRGYAMAKKLREYAAKQPKVPDAAPLVNRIEKTAEALEQMGELTMKDAQVLKNFYEYSPINPNTQNLGKEATNKINRVVSDEMESAASRVEKATTNKELKELTAKYKEYKKKSDSYLNAAKTAQERVLGDMSNRFVSPSDYGVFGAIGIGSAAAGAPGVGSVIAGVGGAVANKQARTRGSAFAARSADALAKGLESRPGQMIERSAGAVANRFPTLGGYLGEEYGSPYLRKSDY